MQQQSRRFAVVNGLMVLVCLGYAGTLVVVSGKLWPSMIFALVPLLAGVSLVFRVWRIALWMQVFFGLTGVLIGFWWYGIASMVTNSAHTPEAEAAVRQIQATGLIVIAPLTLLHFLFACHLYTREEE
jgi:apolipoprotein N-acyltransferase